jgi:hypothetical protein
MDPMEVRLRANFDVKRTADDAPFVRMQHVTDPVTGAITIREQRYVEELLFEFGMTQAKPVPTPSEPDVELRRDAPEDAALTPHAPYAQVVGKLMFLAGCTRPDFMQPVVALAHYLDLWHRKLRRNMQLRTEGPAQVWGDNQGALALVKDLVLHERTKDIDVHHHAVRERAALEEVVFDYCPTSHMSADAMTKGLPRPAFETWREGMGLVSVLR